MSSIPSKWNDEFVQLLTAFESSHTVIKMVSLTTVVNHFSTTLPAEDVDDGAGIGELLKIVTQATGSYKIGTAQVGNSDLG